MEIKGWRTFLWGLFLAVAVPGLTYAAGVDWTQFVSPNTALIISGVVTIALRFVTNTPVFHRE